VPDDAPPSSPVDTADLTAEDRRALADVAAGRLIDSETMTRRLGGWQIARSHAPIVGLRRDTDAPRWPLPADSSAGPSAETIPLVWTQTAAAECERVRQWLAAFGHQSDQRFTAALVTTMIRLIVDGADQTSGIADVPLLPPFALRVLIAPGQLAVLGPRARSAIR